MVYEEDEAWEASSSECESEDSDVVFQARPGAQPAFESAGPAAPGLATLVGHLRCDNLKLRGALVEVQRELESVTIQLDAERQERQRLETQLLGQPDSGDAPQQITQTQKEAVTDGAAAKEISDLQLRLAQMDAREKHHQQEKEELVQQLITCKLAAAEALTRADGLQATADHYQGQLRTMSVRHQNSEDDPVSPLPVSRVRSNVADSECTTSVSTSGAQSPKKKKKSHMKKMVSRLFKQQAQALQTEQSANGEGKPASFQETVPSSKEDAQRQKQVIACLLAELEKANLETQRLQAQLAGQQAGHERM